MPSVFQKKWEDSHTRAHLLSGPWLVDTCICLCVHMSVRTYMWGGGAVAHLLLSVNVSVYEKLKSTPMIKEDIPKICKKKKNH